MLTDIYTIQIKGVVTKEHNLEILFSRGIKRNQWHEIS